MSRKRKLMLPFRALALVWFCVFPARYTAADGPAPAPAASSRTSAAAEPAPARSPVVVLGFLGGFVRRDDPVHSTVQVARSLQKDYPASVHIETFENHRMSDAHGRLLNLLGASDAGNVTDEQKRSARIILYGHSWGASAVVALAQKLKAEGIPVVLTIQVDSVAKSGQNDALIPDNVHYAANFYQDKGLIRGQQKILAADASRTEILGNFRMDYTANPVSCPQYPWFGRVFMRSHIEIECDHHVWQRVEGLIREQLPTSVAGSATSR